MKIALIIPKNGSENRKSFYDYKFYSKFLFSKKYFSYLLAVPVLISLTPKEHEIRVFDENIEEIDFDWPADIAGISVRTMFAERAYAISERFRSKGVKTVLGGIHTSMCQEEAALHSDSIIIGEADKTWPAMLQDAATSGLKKVYKSEGLTDMQTVSIPDRSRMSGNLYFSDIVQTTKGCPFTCEFCSVYAYDGTTIRSRKVEQIIKEVRQLDGTKNIKKRSIFFADDNIIANKVYAKELFTALKELNLNWSCQASINIAREDELLRLMKDSGCGAVLVGLESISDKNLAMMGKKVNLRHDYADSIKKIQSYGILVHSSFIVGYDFDTEEEIEELGRFIEETRLLMPLINILTPFPGTRLFERLEKEGRLLHKEWSKFDAQQVVFKPSLMTPDELLNAHRKLLKKVYSFDAIYDKLKHYWDLDFWKKSNEVDPIRFNLRLLFAARLVTLLFSANTARSGFIIKILPKIFNRRVRVSSILTMMAYNDYAYAPNNI